MFSAQNQTQNTHLDGCSLNNLHNLDWGRSSLHHLHNLNNLHGRRSGLHNGDGLSFGGVCGQSKYLSTMRRRALPEPDLMTVKPRGTISGHISPPQIENLPNSSTKPDAIRSQPRFIPRTAHAISGSQLEGHTHQRHPKGQKPRERDTEQSSLLDIFSCSSQIRRKILSRLRLPFPLESWAPMVKNGHQSSIYWWPNARKWTDWKNLPATHPADGCDSIPYGLLEGIFWTGLWWSREGIWRRTIQEVNTLRGLWVVKGGGMFWGIWVVQGVCVRGFLCFWSLGCIESSLRWR